MAHMQMVKTGMNNKQMKKISMQNSRSGVDASTITSMKGKRPVAVPGTKYKKKMTAAQDEAYDRAHGIKQGSPKDQRLDRMRGVKDKKLSSADRKNMDKSEFVFPGTKRYPIPDANHARNALARSSGKPEEAKVKAAVHRKFPGIK